MFAYWDGECVGLRGKEIPNAPILSWTWFRCSESEIGDAIAILREMKQVLEEAIRTDYFVLLGISVRKD